MDGTQSRIKRYTKEDFKISILGKGRHPSPLKMLLVSDHSSDVFVSDEDRIIFEPSCRDIALYQEAGEEVPSLEWAGPREKLYFDPKNTTAAIVTCGGLCPGLNDVIRAIFNELYYRYGVRRVLGIPFGYAGFGGGPLRKEIVLSPEFVRNIHREGGTILGTSRGTPSTKAIVDDLAERKIDILFVIGGDGTLRAGLDIAKEIDRVKASDIKRVTEELFKEDKLYLALIGPYEKTDEFEALLKF